MFIVLRYDGSCNIQEVSAVRYLMLSLIYTKENFKEPMNEETQDQTIHKKLDNPGYTCELMKAEGDPSTQCPI